MVPPTPGPGQPPGPGLPSATPPAAAAAAQQPKKEKRKLPKPPERAQRTLFCLDLKNPIRKKCIQIVEWKYPFRNTQMFEPFTFYA